MSKNKYCLNQKTNSEEKQCIQKSKKLRSGHSLSTYRVLRNTVATRIGEAKIKSNEKLEKRINETCASNDKLWWKLVKEILNKNGSTQRIPPLLDEDKTVTDDGEKANIFNEYFAKFNGVKLLHNRYM